MENLAKKFISVEEYLTLEKKSDEKHEYCNGELFSMAGAKKNHNIIVSNLIITLGNLLKTRPCIVYPSDMKVAIDAKRHFVYPDVSVVCGESKFLTDEEDVLLNPQVVIEVLSESTEKYDRGKKFEAYRKLQSVQEFVLASSEYKKIEVYSRTGGGIWLLSESFANKDIHLNSIDCSLTLGNVYDKVDLQHLDSTAD